MNEKDLKATKVSKTAKTKTEVEPKAKKTRAKKAADEVVEVKAKKVETETITAEIEPKAKKTSAKAQKVETVQAEPKVSKAKTKITEVAEKAPTKKKTVKNTEAVAASKPKKIAKPVKAKTESKTAKTQVKKAEITEDNEKLPLSAKIQTQENFDLAQAEIEAEPLSPVFKELAEPKLPALGEENRAFLQMQSPTRIFFYWSLKQNSYNTLRRALGSRADDYFLAIRLVNLNTNKDEIYQVESKGSWWFNNIEADSKYRAEVGFYAKGRPFVRIVFSNTLETPRLKPSENTAYQPYFAVTADQFAEVLEFAGFSQDAFEVYLAGDEPQSADEATQKAFVQLAGKGQIDFSDINISELRYILFALASGTSLYSLRGQVAANLFEFLSTLTEQQPDALTEEKVILALEEFFGFTPFEESVEEEVGKPPVFGASLINFPKQLNKKTMKYEPKGKFSPLSSFSLK